MQKEHADQLQQLRLDVADKECQVSHSAGNLCAGYCGKLPTSCPWEQQEIPAWSSSKSFTGLDHLMGQHAAQLKAFIL